MPAGGNLEEMLTKTQLAKYYLKFDYRLKTDDPAAKWKKIGTIVTTSALDMEVREMARLAVNTRKISLPDDAEPGVYKVAVSRRSGDGYMITAEKSEEGVVKWNIPHEKKQPKKHNPLETMLIGMPPGNATYEFKPAYSTAAGWRTMGMGKDKKVPVFPNTIAPGTYNIRATSNIGAASESKMFEAMVGRDGIVKFVMPVPSKRYQGAVESVTPIPVHPER